MKNDIAVFEDAKIRRVYDEETETWFFSVVDIMRVLTGSPDPGAYWRKLKQRLKAEGSEAVTNCHGLNSLPVRWWKVGMRPTLKRTRLQGSMAVVSRGKPEKNW